VKKEMELNDEAFVDFIFVRISTPLWNKPYSAMCALYFHQKKIIDRTKIISESNLEVMDVATGHRKILYRAPGSIQAPNWSKDGNILFTTAQKA
jgi:hypothetical protein